MRICLDPGHGGKDGGAIWGNVREADLNIKIAHRVGSLLENYMEVISTRLYDEDVSLRKRAEIANRKNADIFVSIHCNSFVDPNVSGLEVYCFDLSPKTKGYQLARLVSEKILTIGQVEGYWYKPRGVKSKRFYVIRKTIMPAILIECGFLSNPKEREWLCSAKGQIAIGYAIAQGILSYYEKIYGKIL